MNHSVLKSVIFDQREVIKSAEIMERQYSFEENGCYIITGLRRAGKTTLLYKRVQDLIKKGVSWNQIIYINFEDERLSGFTLSDFNDILSVQAELSDEKGYFFFDEIQNIEGWEKFARRLVDYKEMVSITGSNSTLLSSEMERKLGGRFLSKRVYTYGFSEYLKALAIEHDEEVLLSTKSKGRLLRYFDDYLNYGGFPESLMFKDKRGYVSSVFQKVLLGDIAERNNIRNVPAMRMLIKKLAESVKDEISYTKLYNLLKSIGCSVSKDSLISYLSYAEDAFLIFPIRNYFSKFVERESSPKYYFSDNGLLSLFISDKAPLLVENLVAIALTKMFSDENDVFYLKSDKFDFDGDFYVPKVNMLVQVAFSLEYISSDREWNSLIKAKKSMKDINRCLILTYEEEKAIEIDGVQIEIKPLWKWLLENNC